MKRPARMASEEWLRQCIRKAAPISLYIREGSGLKPPNVRVQDLRRAFLSLHFHQNKD